jgi:hypothetical protein
MMQDDLDDPYFNFLLNISTLLPTSSNDTDTTPAVNSLRLTFFSPSKFTRTSSQLGSRRIEINIFAKCDEVPSVRPLLIAVSRYIFLIFSIFIIKLRNILQILFFIRVLHNDQCSFACFQYFHNKHPHTSDKFLFCFARVCKNEREKNFLFSLDNLKVQRSLHTLLRM